MIHRQLIWTISIFCLYSCANHQSTEASTHTTNRSGWEEMIPSGYALLDSASGDLNLDSIPDLILVLKEENENESSKVGIAPSKRPLLLLLGQADNQYSLAANSENTVYCVDCGGMMGDPYQGITIKDGYFSVEHYGGSGLRWTRIITYKYSSADQHWFLHRDGGESFEVQEPNQVEKYMKTKQDFGSVRFEEFDIYQLEED